jgi:5'-3' exonuclease
MDDKTISDIEEQLIVGVIQKIEEYIFYIHPTKTIYIAFDGVAPFAKMDQQRTRRYKGTLQTSSVQLKNWNTSNITPGTLFMEKLSRALYIAFSSQEQKYKAKHIIVSTSNEVGEGEHKIFQYIRNQIDIQNDYCALYGLDSDLIMLSIFHCKLFKNIYIFREETEFMKTAISLTKPKNYMPQELFCYFMDIYHLGQGILSEMQCKFPDQKRIYDYVFLCFFLGNDFLPHFPALNIRTNGIDILLETYRRTIGSYSDRFFINDMQIQWNWVSVLINELSQNEHAYILAEYDLRAKWDKRTWKVETSEDQDNAMQSIPVIYRATEHYICPSEKHWKDRYYKSLFDSSISRKSTCVNYLEGLEWVFKYYSHGCPHWRWKYNHHYPPLLSDLTHYLPNKSFNFIKDDLQNRPFHPIVQLTYVLPKSNQVLLPQNVQNLLLRKYSRYFIEHFEYEWTFCRYFWESHVKLPQINSSILEKWERDFTVLTAVK